MLEAELKELRQAVAEAAADAEREAEEARLMAAPQGCGCFGLCSRPAQAQGRSLREHLLVRDGPTANVIEDAVQKARPCPHVRKTYRHHSQ